MSVSFNRAGGWAALPMCLAACILLAASGCQAEQNVERMRVIVTLDVAGMENDFREDQRRQETRELRDRLLGGLDSDKVQLFRTLELSGQVVLEIDADVLARIQSAPEVRVVAKDQLLSPSSGE